MIAAFGGTGTPVFTGEELPPSAAGRAAVWRRRKRRTHGGGIAGVSRRRQKGQGHRGFPAPLDSPTFPSDATPSGRDSLRSRV